MAEPAQTQPDRVEPRGWEALAEWTGSLRPEDVEVLRDVRALEGVYPLLHALVGRNLRDFFTRAAALQTLVADGRPVFSARDITEALYWLDDEARESTLRALRASGWLEFDPAAGTSITPAGRWAYDVLGFLHKKLRETELQPTVAGLDYALQIGVDPILHLQSLRSRLNALRQEMDTARASHSELVLRRAVDKLDEALQLSERIRAVLDRVPLDHRGARRVVREIHDLLSQLHGGSAELHSAITEVGRQYLHLTSGMTVEQIVRALMRRSRDELADVGRGTLLAVLRPPPLLNTDVVGSAAEQHVLRERAEPEPVKWTEAPEAPRAADAAELPAEAVELLADLGRIAHEGTDRPLETVVPKRSAPESFLRASLMPLVGDRRAGEGVAGQLGSLPLDIETQGTGWPEEVAGAPIARLTPGQVRVRTGPGGPA